MGRARSIIVVFIILFFSRGCSSLCCTNQVSCSVCSACSVGIFVLPQISRNSQNRLAEMFSHRTRNSQNRLAEDVLPQISLILTDGVCLEFCVFCVFRGTSYAPSGSVKICAICGRIISVAWVIARLVPSALLVHFLLWQAAKPSGDKCTPYSATKRLGLTPRSR